MAKKLRVALVCDWLTGTGGAERVVLELHRMFPEAPIFTSQYDPDSKAWYGGEWFQDADVRTTWLQKLPVSLKKFLPLLRAWTFSRMDFSRYDIVISSSGAEAKGIIVDPSQRSRLSKLLAALGARKNRKGGVHGGTTTADRSVQHRDASISDGSASGSAAEPASTVRRPLHINYCHSPTHYYWVRYDEYLKHPGFGRFDPLARLGLKLLVGPLRKWDFRAAQRPDVMVANSTHTQAMIQKFYKRDVQVVHPPVDVDRFKPQKEGSRHGFVVAGRQTPYKRIDLAVAACSELGVPLVVIGDGPDHRKLERMAGRSVTFLTNTSDEGVAEHFRTALAFIFPGMDDFGITPLEAMAAGTPVIAYKKGGALDYVIEGKTGMFFEKQTVESLVKTLQNFSASRFKPEQLVEHTQHFSPAAFQRNMCGVIDSGLEQKAS